MGERWTGGHWRCGRKEKNQVTVKSRETERGREGGGGRPLCGHATSGGQETNRRPPARRTAEPGTDGRRDEMVPLSVSKRDGWRRHFFFLSMMARDWSASWMQMISTVLKESKRKGGGGGEVNIVVGDLNPKLNAIIHFLAPVLQKTVVKF